MGYAAAIGLIIQVVALVVTTAVALTPTPADIERRRRMEELQKGGGLSDEEKKAIHDAVLNPVQAQERELYRRQGEIAAMEDLSGGQLATQQQAAAERMQKARTDASRAVLQAEIAQKQANQAELTALLGTEGAVQRGQYNAAAQAIGTGADLATAEAESIAYQQELGIDPGAGARAEREAKKKDDDLWDHYSIR